MRAVNAVFDGLEKALDDLLGLSPPVSDSQRMDLETLDQIYAILSQCPTINEQITYLLKKATEPSLISRPRVHDDILENAQSHINTLRIKSSDRKSFQAELDRITSLVALTKFSTAKFSEKRAQLKEAELAYARLFAQLSQSHAEEKKKITDAEIKRINEIAIAQWLQTVNIEMRSHFLARQSADEGFVMDDAAAADSTSDAAAATPKKSPFAAFFQSEFDARSAFQGEFIAERGPMKKNESDARIAADYHIEPVTI